MKKLIKVLEFASVIVAIIIGVVVAKNIPMESILKGEGTAVTLSTIEGGLPEECIGEPAGDDIPRIENVETWENTWQTSYVTVEPIGIIPTGIGNRHPWVSAYTTATRRHPSRRRADVTRMAVDVFDEYGEYFILQLPDESYILAQMPIDDARKLKSGQSITLPIGRKTAVDRQVLANITELCEEYSVNTDGVFYCIDDAWNEDHSSILQLARIGIVILTTIVVGSILITGVEKVHTSYKKKRETN